MANTQHRTFWLAGFAVVMIGAAAALSACSGTISSGLGGRGNGTSPNWVLTRSETKSYLQGDYRRTEIVCEYDDAGNQIMSRKTASGKVLEDDVKYDNNRNIIYQVSYKGDEGSNLTKVTETTVDALDDHGKILKARRTFYDDQGKEESTENYVNEYVYDSAGRLLNLTEMINDTVTVIEEHAFDEAGNETYTRNYSQGKGSGNPENNEETYTTYDEDKRPVTKSVYKNGSLDQKATFTYNDELHEVERRNFDSMGAALSSQTTILDGDGRTLYELGGMRGQEVRHAYDANGNEVERARFDFSDVEERTLMEYDASGNLIAKCYVANGGYDETTYEYMDTTTGATSMGDTSDGMALRPAMECSLLTAKDYLSSLRNAGDAGGFTSTFPELWGSWYSPANVGATITIAGDFLQIAGTSYSGGRYGSNGTSQTGVIFTGFFGEKDGKPICSTWSSGGNVRFDLEGDTLHVVGRIDGYSAKSDFDYYFTRDPILFEVERQASASAHGGSAATTVSKTLAATTAQPAPSTLQDGTYTFFGKDAGSRAVVSAHLDGNVGAVVGPATYSASSRSASTDYESQSWAFQLSPDVKYVTYAGESAHAMEAGEAWQQLSSGRFVACGFQVVGGVVTTVGFGS